MTILRPEIAARLFDTPLMVDARKASAIAAALGGRIVEGGVMVLGAEAIEHIAFSGGRPSAGRVGDRLGRAYDREGLAPFDLVDGVAVIPVEGTLVHKGAYVGSYSGRTSYQGLQSQIVRAARSDAVKGVAFEVDSFGGEVAGAFETADMIAGLSKLKPTIANLTDHALSAGYLLAAPARQVVLPETGRAGSIGVITLHADYSERLAKDGVRVTILAAGAHKADGNPFEPLPDAVAGRIRAELESMRQTFAGAVGRYRGARLDRGRALATEAQDYRGSEAVAVGLADAVGPANDAFAAFVKAVNRG